MLITGESEDTDVNYRKKSGYGCQLQEKLRVRIVSRKLLIDAIA